MLCCACDSTIPGQLPGFAMALHLDSLTEFSSVSKPWLSENISSRSQLSSSSSAFLLDLECLWGGMQMCLPLLFPIRCLRRRALERRSVRSA